MEMDFAGSLDELGDPRAIKLPIDVLNPEKADRSGDGLLTDLTTARGRAALALGAFDSPESRRALERGTHSPEVAAYCQAALYRMSRDQKYLDALNKAAAQNPGFATYLIGNYLRNKVATEAAKSLAQRWQREREAGQAATKPKTEKPAPAKPNRKLTPRSHAPRGNAPPRRSASSTRSPYRPWPSVALRSAKGSHSLTSPRGPESPFAPRKCAHLSQLRPGLDHRSAGDTHPSVPPPTPATPSLAASRRRLSPHGDALHHHARVFPPTIPDNQSRCPKTARPATRPSINFPKLSDHLREPPAPDN
jgi:hypothetical protein